MSDISFQGKRSTLICDNASIGCWNYKGENQTMNQENSYRTKTMNYFHGRKKIVL